MYDRQMRNGETVTLVRPGSPDITASVRAKVSGYLPSDLVGDIQQGVRAFIVPAADVEQSGFPVPFVAKRDSIRWNGRDMVIDSVDDGTRRLAGVLLAYELKVVGA